MSNHKVAVVDALPAYKCCQHCFNSNGERVHTQDDHTVPCNQADCVYGKEVAVKWVSRLYMCCDHCYDSSGSYIGEDHPVDGHPLGCDENGCVKGWELAPERASSPGPTE